MKRGGYENVTFSKKESMGKGYIFAEVKYSNDSNFWT